MSNMKNTVFINKSLILRIRVFNGDYDWSEIVTKGIKDTEQNYNALLQYKEENESDYDTGEYDCTGSVQRRIKIKRRGGRLTISIYESRDV